MIMHRLVAPKGGPKITVNGRTYDPAAGKVQDVPDFDASILTANGWSLIAIAGPTSARPTSSVGAYPRFLGTKFYDTTINHLIVWTSLGWRREDGAIV